MKLIKPRKLAWAFFILAFATTISLGTWQVKRLEWKESLIAQIALAKKQNPIIDLPDKQQELKKLEFYNVKLSGAWLNKEFHVAARYYNGIIGYHVFTPFQLDDGRIVIVNRGWVPQDFKLADKRPQTVIDGEDSISGIIRFGADRNYFTPKSNVDKNLWFARDTEEMAKAGKLKNVIENISIDIVGKQDIKNLPVPSTGAIKLRNDHLSYVVTWYLIALGILLIFIFAHKAKKEV